MPGRFSGPWVDFSEGDFRDGELKVAGVTRPPDGTIAKSGTTESYEEIAAKPYFPGQN